MEAVVSNSTLVYIALSAAIWLVYGILALGPMRLRGGGPRGNRVQHLQMLYFAGAVAVQSALFMSSPMMGRLRGAGGRSSGQAPDLNRQKEFVLALQWTPGICYEGFDYQGNSCKDCYRDHWTIHGLWGLQNFCEVYQTFSVSLLDSLELMNKFWPSCSRSEENFWSYQWTKHGTCLQKFSETNSVTKYFSRAVQLARDANVRSVLAAQGIVPSSTDTVSFVKVKKALDAAFGSSVIVECDGPRYGKSILIEIRICYDKHFRYTNCSNFTPRCDYNIFYEKYPGSNKKRSKPSHKKRR